MWLTPLKYRKPGTLVNDHLYKCRSLYIYSKYFDLVLICATGLFNLVKDEHKRR